jgi:ubiquitin-activating enzyme E1
MVTTNGAPFWSGPKRAPKPITFDPKNPLHLEFVISAANLRAFNFGLKGEHDPEVFLKILPNIMVAEFTPKKVKINTDEKKDEKDETPDLVNKKKKNLIVTRY